MANSFMDRLKRSYSILTGSDAEPLHISPADHVTSNSPSSLSHRVSYDSSKAVLAPIMARISIDAANIPIRHVNVDEFGKFESTRRSELNDRLNIRANIDQSGRAFLQDAVMTVLNNGSCALVPIETSHNPDKSIFEIHSIRVGDIVQWFNRSVEVSVYNENIGDRVNLILPKDYVAIVYNPLYAVMNEPNSTLRRLIDRLALLDRADGQMFSPQLDLIVQLPYTLKNSRRQEEADRRLETIEQQLSDSKYGIAYLDATEKITQLNRPVTNNLVETIAALTESLHAQLGLTPSIFAGSATQEEMLLYNNRTILPILNALTDAMIGSFLTRTAIRQGQTIMAFPDLFKMAPLTQFAEAADALTRNEILTSNEVRAEMGLPPADDPEASKLRNKNLNKQDAGGGEEPFPIEEPDYDDVEGATDE